jgi:4-hydroxy-4-methyl-2-oxoglutarate aldolase
MTVSRETLDAIAQFDTCTVANAIETFGVRLRNEGYTQPGLHAVTGGFPRAIGFAATCRIHTDGPPVGGAVYPESTDWWTAIQTLPLPRIAVIQAEHIHFEQTNGARSGPAPGDISASAIGEVHAAILRAFGCAAAITNGSVRDLPAVSALNFPLFAAGVALSHGYTHLVDYGRPVEIFGLKIRSGDLIYADCHGAISIPPELAQRIPEAAAKIRVHERKIIEACESPDFTPELLLNAIRSHA